jgi:hypothetical protein
VRCDVCAERAIGNVDVVVRAVVLRHRELSGRDRGHCGATDGARVAGDGHEHRRLVALELE